jgi:hypothetical protein
MKKNNNYICCHCGANLDLGDVFQHFYKKYNDYSKAIKTARSYGWSETNQVHFTNAILIHDKTDQEKCGKCFTLNPFLK